MVDRFSDVVQQSGLASQRHVGVQLGRHHGPQERDFLAVCQDVLAVAGSKCQRAQELDQLGMEAGDAGLEHRLLAFFPDPVLDIAARLDHHLLDASRMDPAVDQQMVERHSCHLAADRVESAQDDGFGCVVDDQVDPGRVLERSNVAPFATDDAPLHLVTRDGHHRHRGLGGLLSRDPLHRGHQDIACPLFALLPDDLFPIADLLRDLLVEFFFKVAEDHGPRFSSCHP